MVCNVAAARVALLEQKLIVKLKIYEQSIPPLAIGKLRLQPFDELTEAAPPQLGVTVVPS